jgi:hypothetical protein
VELFEFLRGMRHQHTKLMISDKHMFTLGQMQQALLRADRYLDDLDDEVGGGAGWGGVCVGEWVWVCGGGGVGVWVWVWVCGRMKGGAGTRVYAKVEVV